MLYRATLPICLVLLSLAWPLAGPAADDAPFRLGGEVIVTKISDGDSLRSGKLKIRLHGIDAPELKQQCRTEAGQNWACGVAARDALATMVAAPLHCELRDVDRYGRLVMRCLAAGRDVAEELVSQGLALAYRRYSNDYVAAEGRASAEARGMWQGVFEAPWDWRRDN